MTKKIKGCAHCFSILEWPQVVVLAEKRYAINVYLEHTAQLTKLNLSIIVLPASAASHDNIRRIPNAATKGIHGRYL